MDFESPDVEKDFPGLYASESARKSNESDYSDDGVHDKHSKKELLGGVGAGGKKKEKKDKKDRGYATLEGESSPDEAGPQETKSPSKSKKTKTFKFPSKKREKSREKDTTTTTTTTSTMMMMIMKEKDKDEKDGGKKKRDKDDKEKEKDKLTKHKMKDRKKLKHNEETMEIGEIPPVFGVSLKLAVERSRCHDGVELPIIVRDCIDYLEEFGMTTESLYKLPAVKSKVQNFKKLYNQRKMINSSDFEPSVAASLLIHFLKELPEPILENSGMVSKFEQAASTKDVAQRESQLAQLVRQLPECNRILLAWITLHLDHITIREKTTKMNAQTIAMTLSPVLQMSHRLLLALLCHCKALFPDVHLTKYIPPLSSGSVNFPDDPESITKELLKQESLLAQLHGQMNAGFVTKSCEEQLWEVQRIITQLKRKYKTFQKLECQMQKSLDEDSKLSCNSSSSSTATTTITNQENYAILQKPILQGCSEAAHSESTSSNIDTKSQKGSKDKYDSPNPTIEFPFICDKESQQTENTAVTLEKSSNIAAENSNHDITNDGAIETHQESEEGTSIEAIREFLIYQELMNTEKLLKARITQERNEIKKLTDMLAEKGGAGVVVVMGPSSVDKVKSRERMHSPNEAEITAMIQLSKENQLLEKKMSTLIQSIIEEKDACVELKVQLAMHQLSEKNYLYSFKGNA